MRGIGLVIVQTLGLLFVPRALCQPSAESARDLESKISGTPAQSIDLGAAAKVAASGRVASPVPGAVVPAATRLKPGEARFVALSRDDEESMAELARAQLGDESEPSVKLFRGAVRTLGADEQPVTLKAVALARGALRYNQVRGRFEGLVSVGVVSITPGAAPKLAAPVVFQVLGEVSATPPSLSVDHTAPPYEDILVAIESPSRAVAVQVMSGVTPEGVSLSLAASPAVRLRATPAQIQGWGLESADVTLEIVGPREQGMSELQLSSTLGRLSENSLRVPSGIGTTELRSEGLGTAALTASGPGISEGKLEIDFLFPWVFLLAAPLGGFVGGFLRHRLKLTRVELWVSIFLGALTAALYALGLDAIGLTLPARTGEILTFVLAALGAYGGTGLLTHLTGARGRS